LEPNTDQPHVSGPSLWPIGFAIGVACVLVGLLVSAPAVIVGAVIAILSASLWIRDATRGYSAPPAVEPERRPVRTAEPVPADAGGPALPVMTDEEIERFPRSVFLEGATLGLGAVIGGVVAVPALGFMVAPAFVGQKAKSVDVGPLSDFPEGQYTITTFLRNPAEGEVTRRTAYVRNNGIVDNVPNFTIISNRCAHLGCPVQPGGPIFEDKKKTANTGGGEEVTIIPMLPAGGFVCPCHGGAYDQEGNRVAGPPVRALDRYEFEVRDGHLILLGTYSVAHVKGTGGSAEIEKYILQDPGEPVRGIESWMYPIQPPR
jgi:menaquinol-cytochrome c reductase iron-sulfur subunit